MRAMDHSRANQRVWEQQCCSRHRQHRRVRSARRAGKDVYSERAMDGIEIPEST